jgi:hypothetical protein
VFDAYLHVVPSLFPVYDGAMNKEPTLSKRRKAINQREFLKNFQRTGILSEGADAAGVSRQTVYYWKKTSPSFMAKMMEALDVFEQTGDGHRLASISILAQAGDRDMQNYIRINYGPQILKKVMSGKNLTLRMIKA